MAMHERRRNSYPNRRVADRQVVTFAAVSQTGTGTGNVSTGRTWTWPTRSRRRPLDRGDGDSVGRATRVRRPHLPRGAWAHPGNRVDAIPEESHPSNPCQSIEGPLVHSQRYVLATILTVSACGLGEQGGGSQVSQSSHWRSVLLSPAVTLATSEPRVGSRSIGSVPTASSGRRRARRTGGGRAITLRHRERSTPSNHAERRQRRVAPLAARCTSTRAQLRLSVAMPEGH
jgi:hypothetical protein